MKVRNGFVSNSSTSSFIVKTKPTYSDKVFARNYNGNDKEKKEYKLFVLPPKKVKLLKKMGFVPTKHENPFKIELNCPEYDNKRLKKEITDDTLLKFSITCNHRDVLKFLVAHDIPFRASVHYSHYLYSYQPEDGCVYILPNFGIKYIDNPKRLEEKINDGHEKQWLVLEPFQKISKKEFLKSYNEKDSLMIMTE